MFINRLRDQIMKILMGYWYLFSTVLFTLTQMISKMSIFKKPVLLEIHNT